MQKGKLLIGLFGLDANKEFHYTRYFSMFSAGPKPSQAFTEGYFQVAAQQKPKPETIALAAEDAEFSRNACEGARENPRRPNSPSSTTRTLRPARPTSRRLFAR